MNATQAYCTKLDVEKLYAPLNIRKFDFVEFDNQRIFLKIRQDQEIDVQIKGKKYKALLKEMKFNAQDTGSYSYSGVLDGVSRSSVLITINPKSIIGDFTLGDDTYNIHSVGLRKTTTGNTSPVYMIYNQNDVEDYQIESQ